MDFPEITDRGRVPKYRQVAHAIIAAIESGELHPGDVIPSEKDIMNGAGVGRNAARQAVEWLRAEGWIETVAGRGSYVRQRDDS